MLCQGGWAVLTFGSAPDANEAAKMCARCCLLADEALPMTALSSQLALPFKDLCPQQIACASCPTACMLWRRLQASASAKPVQ